MMAMTITHAPSDYQCPFCALAVFPRYSGDELYTSRPYPEFVTAGQRQPYGERLRRYFATQGLWRTRRETGSECCDVAAGAVRRC